MIFQFFGFVQWPEDRDYRKQSHVNICVLGKSPVTDSIARLVPAASQKAGKQYSLVTLKSWKEAAACHALFIAQSEEPGLGEILAGLKTQPVLTFSDIDNFIDHGGMIGFLLSGKRMKFAINVGAAEATGIRINALALELAIKTLR